MHYTYNLKVKMTKKAFLLKPPVKENIFLLKDSKITKIFGILQNGPIISKILQNNLNVNPHEGNVLETLPGAGGAPIYLGSRANFGPKIMFL